MPEPIGCTECARGDHRLLQSSAAAHPKACNIDRGVVQWPKPEALWLARDQRYGGVCKEEGPVVRSRPLCLARRSRGHAVDPRLSHAKASSDKTHGARSGGRHVKMAAPSFKARARIPNPSASRVWVGRQHWRAVDVPACGYCEVHVCMSQTRSQQCGKIISNVGMVPLTTVVPHRKWYRTRDTW